MTTARLVISTSVFLTLFYNVAFFRNVAAIYPFSSANITFIGSVALIFTSLMVVLITLISSRYTTKAVLILILTVSSLAAYFMNAYNIIIDADMIQNIIETDVSESMDLFSFKLLAYFLLLGILPSICIYKINIEYGSLKTEFFTKLKVMCISLAVIAAMFFNFSKHYTSFCREHKPIRYYANPAGWIYAAGKSIKSIFNDGQIVVAPIGTDAEIPSTDIDRELIILVVGEALRADRLSLNGYHRETNPLLAKEEVISFTHMYSCGTCTAVSVPCMFSIFDRDEYSNKKGRASENLLDVLHHAGVNILWRDNNSSSKGTALRVPYENFRHSDKNSICDDGECRDEGMLVGLQEYINRTQTGDIFIILHQMGSHGPAYYKRYPKSFEKFTPVCQTNQLEECTVEEIGNAYDNAVLYTDYFLSKTINLLKQNTSHFETAMVYFSDHGESLGEKGLYLHGLPYYMAPDAQKHIGAMMWFGDSFEIDKDSLKKKSVHAFSQDNLFHTILGLMEIETDIYDKSMDIVNYDK
ncbi:MAG: phosphoethanolamine--lipid A transferase [Desulfobacteraceae bacterium]|nr:phosphoethanolamine--lipid A transferase [Desulfobacteraceae bacterium]